MRKKSSKRQIPFILAEGTRVETLNGEKLSGVEWAVIRGRGLREAWDQWECVDRKDISES